MREAWTRLWRTGGRTLLTVCALGACSTLPDSAPDIRGVITNVQSARAGGDRIGSVLVEENPGETSGSAKDYIMVTTATRIFLVQGEERRRASFDQLRRGQRVEAWYEGPVAESYPRQATGRVIVVRG